MYEEYLSCKLCPRRCGVNRHGGEMGFCGSGDKLMVARAAPHFWEEPCLSGEKGSGTVFFSGCTLRCAYCQNAEISSDGKGYEISEQQLAKIFLSLQKSGVHNINLVTPTHFAPQIIASLRLAVEGGLIIPVVYNCGGYETAETVRLLAPYVDIWLPDFKYFSEKAAVKYSAAPHYKETATAAIDEMVRSAPEPLYDEDGMMKSGVIVRHLLLPSLLADSLSTVKFLHERYGEKVVLSLMSQYTPPKNAEKKLEKFPNLQRGVSRRHYEALVDFACECGVQNAYTQQEGCAEESFIPTFDGTGLGI